MRTVTLTVHCDVVVPDDLSNMDVEDQVRQGGVLMITPQGTLRIKITDMEIYPLEVNHEN